MTPAEELAVTRAKSPRTWQRRVERFVCRVREVREGLNLSRAAVGGELGFTAAFLTNVERGVGINLTTALKIAAFFGRPVEELWQPLAEGEPDGN